MFKPTLKQCMEILLVAGVITGSVMLLMICQTFTEGYPKNVMYIGNDPIVD